MKKKVLLLLSLLLISTLVLAACAPAEEDATEEPMDEATEEPMDEDHGFLVGMVTDTGGVDDRSFNQSAWEGMENAAADLGITAQVLESNQQTDYAVNIQSLVDQGAAMVMTVGFLLGDDTLAMAEANPDTLFAIQDYGYESQPDNLMAMVFNTQEAAFLVGYASAGMTQTGIVGMFGGIEIPPVTVFMDGFAAGVAYYNEANGTDVVVLGRDLFVGNFESTDDGRRVAEDLIAEGADIIMPVAGPVGLGTAAAIMDNPGTMLVGVDTDWCVSAPDFCSVTLTSVMKRVDNAAAFATTSAFDGSFTGGGLYIGTLENGGVDIAPFNEFDSAVSQDIKDALDIIRGLIISGELDITAYYPGM
jgi:basic membrane protein A